MPVIQLGPVGGPPDSYPASPMQRTGYRQRQIIGDPYNWKWRDGFFDSRAGEHPGAPHTRKAQAALVALMNQVIAEGREDIISPAMRGQLSIWSADGGAGTLVPKDPFAQTRAKATITTADGGAWSPRFGGVGILQLADQHNLVGGLGHWGYDKNGFRAISTRGVSADVGITQGGALPTAVEPTWVEIDVGQKDMAEQTEMSIRHEVTAIQNDSVRWDHATQTFLNECMFAWNADLVLDTNTTANTDPESVDRVCMTSGANTNLSYDTADEDLYGVDRSANTWFNSANCAENAGTNRPITIALIKTMQQNAYSKWESIDSKAYFTTHATLDNWSALEEAKQRLNEASFTNTLGMGVQQTRGQAGGFLLTTWRGNPIIVDEAINNGRIYLVDQLTTGHVLARPPSIIRSENIVEVGSAIERAAWYGIGELWTYKPASCAMARDFSE